MKDLVTIKVVAGAIGLTGRAFLFQSNRAETSVGNFFNLVGRRLAVFPNIYKTATAIAKPITILGFLLTSKSREGYEGDGNGYSFHIHKILIMVGFCKSIAKQHITIC